MRTVYLIYNQKPMEIKEINRHEMILPKRSAIENNHKVTIYSVRCSIVLLTITRDGICESCTDSES